MTFLKLAGNFRVAKSIVIKGSLFVVVTSSVSARKRVPYKHLFSPHAKRPQKEGIIAIQNGRFEFNAFFVRRHTYLPIRACEKSRDQSFYVATREETEKAT